MRAFDEQCRHNNDTTRSLLSAVSDTALRIPDELCAKPTLSDEEIFFELRKIIIAAKNALKASCVFQEDQPAIEGVALLSVSTPQYVLAVTVLVLTGRALSCTYRYVTTNDALQMLFNQSFVHQGKKPWAMIVAEDGAFVFCLTDTFVTLGATKYSIEKLCHIRRSMRQMFCLLRDETGQLPCRQLIALLLLMPGGILGAFYKGKVGVPAMALSMESWFTSQPTAWIDSVSVCLGYFAGVCTALCYLAFQGHQALEQIYIGRSLKYNPHYAQFATRKKWMMWGNTTATFLVSLSSSLVAIAAKFYSKGNLDLDVQTVTEVLIIGLSGLILNTFFTTGPKYLHMSIEEKFQENNAHQRALWIVLLGLTSSLGTCLALFPSMVKALLFATQKKTLTDEALWLQILGVASTVFLSIFLFPRDYMYYTKTVLELWELHVGSKNQSAQTQTIGSAGCLAKVSGFFSLFMRKINKTPKEAPCSTLQERMDAHATASVP